LLCCFLSNTQDILLCVLLECDCAMQLRMFQYCASMRYCNYIVLMYKQSEILIVIQDFNQYMYIFSMAQHPKLPGTLNYRGFTITFRHTTPRRTPLNESSARRRDFYVTTHNTHKRQRAMPPPGFEPTIPPNERPHTHALDRAAIGIGR
jgi:hypothetical protein